MSIKRSTFLFIILIGLATLTTVFFGFSYEGLGLRTSPAIHRGVLDLSDFDFNKIQLIHLHGDVEFYWEKLLTLQDFNNDNEVCHDGYIKVPGIWNGYEMPDTIIGGSGYATYRFKIKVPEDGWYGLKIKEFDCAYNLWFNGEKVSVGQVGASKEQTIPSWKREEVNALSVNKTLDVVLQVANFHHWKGGAEDVMLLGKSRDVIGYKNQQIAVGFFLLGCLLIMAIYHLGVYFFRSKERFVILFSLLCFAIIFRLLTTGEKIILDLFPSLSWYVAIRIEYVSYAFAVPLFLAFIHSFYPEDVSKHFVKVVFLLGGLFALVPLVTPPAFFTYSPIVYQFVPAVVAVYVLYVLVKVAVKKRADSFVFLTGYVFFFLIVANDILYYNRVITTSYLIPHGLFVLLFSNAFALSRRVTNAFNQVELLTVKLDKYNQELEQKVADRTREIVSQKEEIQQQALNLSKVNEQLTELNRFKESMTSMIVHDLKNPLNTIINIAPMADVPDKEAHIQLAGRQMLNLVMNILDVNRHKVAALKPKPQNTNLVHLIKDAIGDVSFMAAQRSLVLRLNMEGEFETEIDPALIRRVIVNLLLNAIKFSPVKAQIEISVFGEIDKIVKVVVKDEGPGVRKEQQELIFNPYTRLDQQDYYNKSTGLGLAFCKMAIEAHKGVIGVNSVPMQGASFWFSLNYSTFIAKAYEEGGHGEEQPLQAMLSLDEWQALEPYFLTFKQFEVYQVSEIGALLEQLKIVAPSKLSDFICELENAVACCDEQLYQELLKKLNL
ncbi:hypothetical protein DMA11_21340 [Marinilabiliaceae bacterium JC017]|nr:hypothetical protein DMA11_21340 [Marinilabiliaceae bacterium JC017]